MEHYIDTGYVEIYAGVDPKRTQETLKVILDECYQLASGTKPITDIEVNKAKEYVKGHLALSLEDTRNINDFFGEEELLLNKFINIEEVFEKIDKVTHEEILFEAKKIFVPGHINLAVIGPFKTKVDFENLIK